MIQAIKLLVGSKVIGEALTWAYPAGKAHGIFWIPTYQLTVTGNNSTATFEVIRFGIQCKTSKSSPVIVGLSQNQNHVIKAWLPNYSVHSAHSKEMGAWQVYDNFLIHDGPDDPKSEVYASIGGIEICNGPEGFDLFNDTLINMAKPKSSGRNDKLIEIANSKQLSIEYLAASRPPLKKV